MGRLVSPPAAAAVALTAAAAGLLYLSSVAPGLTWAHQGADGGELLAAAAVNGVPHPPGYPLYTLLLQGWLALGAFVAPGSDLALRGNLFSVLCAACSAAFTAAAVAATAQHIDATPRRWLWGALAGLAWAVSPLVWSQAVITEVYALHALFVALLGWAALSARAPGWALAVPAAGATAHHFTLLLLLPAAFYGRWSQSRTRRKALATGAWLLAGALLGALLYARVLWAAQRAPPVNWGYAGDWAGLWWLVSGSAYRGYLFALPPASILGRVGAWANTLSAQYTLAGLAIALVGLSWFDRNRPLLRTFTLLWIAPVSVYAIGYYTRDSDIYLLGASWAVALCLGAGLAAVAVWLEARFARSRSGAGWRRVSPSVVALVAGLGIVTLAAWRWPALALRGDDEARRFVAEAARVLQPDSIVVSRSDAPTFALWYGAWGSGELSAAAPGLVVINDALYQFTWYQRLQRDLHPGVPAVGESAAAAVAANADARPVYFAEPLDDVAAAAGGRLVAEPPLWRFEFE